MITLDDIDILYPDDEWGTLYRDLYKEHWGEWPHGLMWATPEDFLEEFDRILEDDWSESTSIEEDSEDDLGFFDDERDILADLGYDHRMNREDEWD